MSPDSSLLPSSSTPACKKTRQELMPSALDPENIEKKERR